MKRWFPVLMLGISSTVLGNVPIYIQHTASRHNLEVTDLYQSGELWPWLVWRDETPIRLRDQTSLVKYLAADPGIAFGPWRMRLRDYPQLDHVQLSDPRVQVELVARRIRDAKLSRKNLTLPGFGKYQGKYQDLINAAGQKYGVDPLLIAAVITQESAYRINAVSSKGARGLMQVMPDTARAMGYDPDDMFTPAIAIDAGTNYLARQLRDFKKLDLALAAYNAGPGNVRKYGNTVPPFPETTSYVATIIKKYQGVRK